MRIIHASVSALVALVAPTLAVDTYFDSLAFCSRVNKPGVLFCGQACVANAAASGQTCCMFSSVHSTLALAVALTTEMKHLLIVV